MNTYASHQPNELSEGGGGRAFHALLESRALNAHCDPETCDPGSAAKLFLPPVQHDDVDRGMQRPLPAGYRAWMRGFSAARAEWREQREQAPGHGFQVDVREWVERCFGREIADDRLERCHRFIEEALELAQAAGMPRKHAHQLVEYVYGRPEGELRQELGGVMVTLAAWASAFNLCMRTAGSDELQRVWGKIDEIRRKQAAKKAPGGPLP